MRSTSVLVLAVVLAGCQTGPRNAPVSERRIVTSETSSPSRAALPTKPESDKKPDERTGLARPEKDWRPDKITIKRGDTLYAIALDYGLDYRELATWNGIADPHRIQAGQSLRLTPPPVPVLTPEPPAVAVVARPLDAGQSPVGEALPSEVSVRTEPKVEKIPYSDDAYTRMFGQDPVRLATKPDPGKVVSPVPPQSALPSDKSAVQNVVRWGWPAQGEVLVAFDGVRTKGVVIAGNKGDSVLAASDGKVVYVGSAIQAYGHLAIVKHGAEYLTVYAHNASILVKEGQQVTAGQKIAEMGARPGSPPALHFEVRKLGKPVDPMKILPAR